MIAVNEIFHGIQGEGTLTGLPMVFIRLQGCSTRCPWCLVKGAWSLDPRKEKKDISVLQVTSSSWVYVTEQDLAALVKTMLPSSVKEPWVSITGGEPGEQSLRTLSHLLRLEGFRLGVETNGLFRSVLETNWDWLTVSPKLRLTAQNRGRCPEVITRANELKFVITGIKDVELLLDFISIYGVNTKQEICLQPAYNTKDLTAICHGLAKRSGWRVSIPTQKVLEFT